MAAVEGDRVAGQEAPHHRREPDRAGPEEHVGVIREERPGVHRGSRGLDQRREPGDERLAVRIIADDAAPVQPTDHHVVERPGGIEAGVTRHGGRPPLEIPRKENTAPGNKSTWETTHYARQKTLDTDFALHPERFVRNPPRHQEVPQQAWINPPKAKSDLQVAPRSTIATPANPRVVVPMNLLQTEVSPLTKRVVHYMPTVSVSKLLTGSADPLQRVVRRSMFTWFGFPFLSVTATECGPGGVLILVENARRTFRV